MPNVIVKMASLSVVAASVEAAALIAWEVLWDVPRSATRWLASRVCVMIQLHGNHWRCGLQETRTRQRLPETGSPIFAWWRVPGPAVAAKSTNRRAVGPRPSTQYAP